MVETSTFKDLSFIDSMRSVAVVGTSKKRGYFFLKTFLESFKGPVYAIKPGVEKIDAYPDVEVFGRLTDIPANKPVDYVYISVPKEHILPIIDDCVAKGVKLVSIFTSNFAEEGTDEGRALQRELVKHCNVGEKSVRILGPNGMGLYSPKLGIRWRPSLPQEHGDAGLLVQSGGLSNVLIHGLTAEHIGVSKAFSIGNAADVNALDVFNYLANDPGTSMIVQYLEGLPPGTGRAYLNLIRDCKKPVILIKGGRTETGSRAATTHTAALVGNIAIWEKVVWQAGAIIVQSFMDVMSVAKQVSMLGMKKVKNACVMSLSGGYGVICTDVLEEHGIALPDFREREDTFQKLSDAMQFKGISFNNPVDLAATFVYIEVLEKVFRIVLEEETVDGVVLEIATPILAHSFRSDRDVFGQITDLLVKLRNEQDKPIMIISQDVGYPEFRKKLKNKLQPNKIPVFNDVLPLARTLRYINKAHQDI